MFKSRLVVAILAALVAGATASLILLVRHERSSLAIRLRWIRSHDKETWSDAKTGLWWSLSFLGARLDDSADGVIIPRSRDNSVFELRIDRAGFSAGAQRSLSSLFDTMKATGEYRERGALDLGRFVAVMLGDSKIYYAITQAPGTLGDFRAAHHLDRGQTFPILNSDVAKHSRLVRFVIGPKVDQMAFVAEELSGTYGKDGVRALTHEVIDLMPNGQLRFAIYGPRGQLIEGTPPSLSTAGKPAKCLWCHEINLFSLFRDTPDQPGHMTADAFSAEMSRARTVVTRHRDRLRGLIDFRQTQDHTQTELLYIAFMEPSAERLSREWGVDVAEVKRRMAGQSTHLYPEFPFLGPLYERRFADRVASYRSMLPPASVREPGPGDVNELRNSLR